MLKMLELKESCITHAQESPKCMAFHGKPYEAELILQDKKKKNPL